MSILGRLKHWLNDKFKKPNGTEAIIKIPAKNNDFVIKLIKELNINSLPIYVKINPEKGAEIGMCFDNVRKKVDTSGGKVVYGWSFLEEIYFIEAEFHAIWQSPQGKLYDITPPIDSNYRKTLFVEDKQRKYSGRPTDNKRINITDNPLIEDIIRVEEAKWRFINQEKFLGILGEVPLEQSDAILLQDLENFTHNLDEMYFRNISIDSVCPCDSGKSFKNCHQIIIKEFCERI